MIQEKCFLDKGRSKCGIHSSADSMHKSAQAHSRLSSNMLEGKCAWSLTPTWQVNIFFSLFFLGSQEIESEFSSVVW